MTPFAPNITALAGLPSLSPMRVLPRTTAPAVAPELSPDIAPPAAPAAPLAIGMPILRPF